MTWQKELNEILATGEYYPDGRIEIQQEGRKRVVVVYAGNGWSQDEGSDRENVSVLATWEGSDYTDEPMKSKKERRSITQYLAEEMRE